MSLIVDNDGTISLYQGDSGELVIYGLDESKNYTVYLAVQDKNREMIGEELQVSVNNSDSVTFVFTPEFELMPEHIAKIYMLYGDLPQVVSKIILPQILSVTRMKGSSYKAQDFIVGAGREIFQNNLRSELEKVLGEKSIVVHNAIIRNVTIPDNILKPIQDASLAVEQNLTNFSLQETAKIEARLNEQTAMIDQKRREIEQETRKITAEIAAQQRQAVQMINAEADLEVAELQLKRSELEAARAKLKGETDVQVAFLRNNERAQGVEMKAKALGASGVMADLTLVEKLNPKVKLQVIYAGEGTLWTDLKSGSITVKK